MNALIEKLRAVADSDSLDSLDARLLRLAANELEHMEAHNKRLMYKLMKIAEGEEYK